MAADDESRGGSVLTKIAVLILILIGVAVWYKKFRSSSWSLNRLWKTFDECLRNNKIELFAPLPQLRDHLNRDLQILEIGSGGGFNFRYFPDGSRVTCVDINPDYKTYVEENLKAQNTQVYLKDFICGNAENLHQLADESFDVVVCTYLLSSVQSPPAVLKEARRVLKPKGQFYFMENVFGKIGDKARVAQKIMAPFYPFLFDGIKLMIQTDDIIRDGGFSQLTLREFKFEPPQALLFPMRSSICGVATK